MAVIDWRIASVGVMVLMGVFNVLARKFFDRGEDWRIFIPIAAAVCLVLVAYFAISYKEIKIAGEGIAFALALGAMAAVIMGLTAAVYADKDAPLGVAIPIMGMSIVVTAGIAMVALGEPVTPVKIAGIILGAISIALLSIQ